MVKVLDSQIMVNDFEFQSCSYNVHIQTNIQGKGMNPFILLVKYYDH